MNKTILMFALIAVIFFSVGMGAGILISGSLDKQIDLAPEAKVKLPEEPPAKVPKITMPEILYNLTGIIQEIERNSIVLEVNIPYVDETNQIVHKIEIRKAIINTDTKFSDMSFIDTEDANRKTIQESEIIFQDLKIGDQIEVISNKDIKDKQEFEAVKVRILP